MNRSGGRLRGDSELLGACTPVPRSSSRLRTNRRSEGGSPSSTYQLSNIRIESDAASTLVASRGKGGRRASMAYQLTPKRNDSDVKVHTAFSIGAVHRVFSSFKGEKERIVESIGFGGLLKIQQQSRFPRLLVLWLVRHMDPINGTMRLPNGEELPVAATDVELVFALPRGKRKIKCGLQVKQSDVTKIKTSLMLNPGEEITLAYLEKLLVKDYGTVMSTREKEAFKIAAALYADAYFLAPKGTKAKVNQELFRYISDAAFIETYDWCEYVLKVLIESTKRARQAMNMGEKKVTLDGCLLFWVVYYIDNIEFGGGAIFNHCALPRVVDFPYSKVKELVGDDQCRTDAAGVKSFGQNKLRPSTEVIYSRNRDISLRSDEMRRILKCNRSTPQSGTENAAIESKIVRIIDNWSKDVNHTTIVARQALMQCVAKEYLTKNSRIQIEDEGRTGSVINQENAAGQASTLTEKDYIDLVSDEDVEMSEVNDVDNTANLNQPEDSVDASVHRNDDNEKETYDCVLIKRFSGIGLRNQIDGSSDTFKSQEPKEMQPNGTELSLIVWKGGDDEETTIPQDNYKLPDDEETVGREQTSLVLRTKEVATKGTQYTEDMDGVGMELETLVLGSHDIDNPTPLCVVRSDQYISTEDEIALLQENELVLDESYIDPTSKFGISPFTINLTHMDAPLKCQLNLERGLRTQTDEYKKRTWYRNTETPEIEISGALLEQMFTGEYDLTIAAVNAIMRLFQEMDTEMYANWKEKRWRHFLPVEFAVIAINGTHNGSDCRNEELASMFTSSTINYNVDECRLIFAPLMIGFHWSMYAWDFEKRRIVVLDPLAMRDEKEILDEKHRKSIALMHRTMLECGAIFFPSNLESEEIWQTEYIKITGGDCTSYNSGIYSMFYARYFDGDFITRILTKGACRMQKLNFLYQLLTMHGNEGDPPLHVLGLVENNRALKAP